MALGTGRNRSDYDEVVGLADLGGNCRADRREESKENVPVLSGERNGEGEPAVIRSMARAQFLFAWDLFVLAIKNRYDGGNDAGHKNVANIVYVFCSMS